MIIIDSFSGILLSAAGRGKGVLVSSFNQKLLTDYQLIRVQPSETHRNQKKEDLIRHYRRYNKN